jgi:ATP-dependent helicase Lhr and Lhr-like helicase
MTPANDSLSLFLPPVGEWFRAALGEPTPAQTQSWPLIAAGKHTLILAPTGSGKTLAAFLACLDGLWRQDPVPPGVRVLYISPLKALNNDIHRNLQIPLAGVAEMARRMGVSLPELTTAVRTGDTPAAERQRLIKKPPHVLITTPESLHLLLTSKARETLRNVTHCIVDEIHALSPNKRGVFLALLLERLAALAPKGFLRIGLSATQRPLEEVARFLGGSAAGPDGGFTPRPVSIVDAGMRKDLDLRVVCPVDHFGPQPEKSIWPAIYRLLREHIRDHRSTIVFANNRRTVERITASLNDDEEIARAHHGSVSLEVRQATEAALKEGRLPAVVATGSLELGIDMGAVDLVCQVESPGSVSRGLQRVGRAGHLVGQTSKGRLIPKMPSDLLEQAVLAREMAAGRVEEIHVPINCLDILAQQLVALAAQDTWNVPDLFALVRRAYPFRDLSAQAFETVLEMISGRYRLNNSLPVSGTVLPSPGTPGEPSASTLPSPGTPEEPSSASTLPSPGTPGEGSGVRARSSPRLMALEPRVSWDRVHNRLHALPGSKQMVLLNGGTIPDTGQYAAFTHTGVRIGELDEEFVYERRVGDAFLLGTNAWRVDKIEADRVIVAPAEGAPALVPFWRGESTGRSHALGVALGGFLRDLAQYIDSPNCLPRLESEYLLDARSARNVRDHVRRQLAATGCLPTDKTLVIEASRDPLGDWQVILLSPLGNRLHFGLRLALEHRLQERFGYRPQCLHHADGILIRLTDTDEPILDLFNGLTPENVEPMILDALADSALFALRFRQNAARALLLPRSKIGKRAPLWLQRLRGRDLLQVARQHPDFPIVVETYRECLHDHLDMPRLQELLADIREKRIAVVARRAETPSPFASGLLFSFTAAFMYQYDDVEPRATKGAPLNGQLLDQLLAPQRHGHLLDPRAVHQVERRLRGLGYPPRSKAEAAEWLRRLGDLTPAELEGPTAEFLDSLQSDGLAQLIELPGCREPQRWVLTEEASVYGSAFGMDQGSAKQRQEAAETILGRFLETHALVGLDDVLNRYPFESAWATRKLEEWARGGRLVPVRPSGDAPSVQWSAPANLEQVQRGSLALLRREVLTCSPAQFADFVVRWQMLHPEVRRGEAAGLEAALDRLQGLPLSAELWERVVLPARVPGYQARWLDEIIASGSWTWACQSTDTPGPGMLAFFTREQQRGFAQPIVPDATALSPQDERVLECLLQSGASFVADLAAETGAPPGDVRASLWNLLSRSLVSNDRFDVIRKGEDSTVRNSAFRRFSAENRLKAELRTSGKPPFSSRRETGLRAEGRWSLVDWGHPDPEERTVLLAGLLLHRYGIVARELALLDPWMAPWRSLYEVLTRMELAGEVRRGYFVEGLSGAQFALPEAAEMLQNLHAPSTAAAPVLLLHSLDPANLYGGGAPFDVPLLDGGTRSFARRAGNWLVVRAGCPILLVEGQGKRLTALASASLDDKTAAVARLGAILDGDHTLAVRHKLAVEEWNGQPVTGTEGRELLEAAGFVRDYQGMVLYAAWR